MKGRLDKYRPKNVVQKKEYSTFQRKLPHKMFPPKGGKDVIW